MSEKAVSVEAREAVARICYVKTGRHALTLSEGAFEFAKTNPRSATGQGVRDAYRRADEVIAALRSDEQRAAKPIIFRPDRRVDAAALRTLADYIESDTHLKPGNKVSWSDVLEAVRRHYLTTTDAPTAGEGK